MGFKTFGFGGGREDVWEPEEDIYWGPETEWLGDERYTGDRELENPLGAVQMGLIYVNPEGPNGNPIRWPRPRHPRDLRAHGDERRGDRRARRRRTHLRQVPRRRPMPQYVGREPEGAGIEEQGLGWKSSFGSGKGDDTISSGLEGAWTPTPTKWDNSYFDILFGYEWELTKSPAGASSGRPRIVGDEDGAGRPRPVEDARPDDDHRGHRAADRPDLRADLAALPREPGGVRRRVRPGVVQADPPRHGPARATSARTSRPRS